MLYMVVRYLLSNWISFLGVRFLEIVEKFCMLEKKVVILWCFLFNLSLLGFLMIILIIVGERYCEKVFLIKVF